MYILTSLSTPPSICHTKAQYYSSPIYRGIRLNLSLYESTSLAGVKPVSCGGEKQGKLTIMYDLISI